MRFGLKEEEIQAIVKVLSGYKQLQSAILYGSRAKGTFKTYSDIDLTLIGDGLDLSMLQKIETELDDLLLPYKMDISLFKHIKNNELLGHIHRVGKPFYVSQSEVNS
ncbi:MAG: nucleotidyltransferase domain-containing protein [Bacteroidetes bacterium]|nr:nucleotidyltransferase domain-containing protein [Bacteroidota bacterium]NCQ10719.1 nucleotidyltransferase domain-containing protein [Bacteroidota bacterium]